MEKKNEMPFNLKSRRYELVPSVAAIMTAIRSVSSTAYSASAIMIDPTKRAIESLLKLGVSSFLGFGVWGLKSELGFKVRVRAKG